MVAYGSAAEMKLCCDVGGAKSANKQSADFNFSLAERIIWDKEDVLSQLWIYDAQA